MIKKLVFVLLISLVVQSAYSQNRRLIDKVVAIVGNEYVLFSDVEEEFAVMQQRTGELDESVKCDILENQLITQLLANQAKLDSIEVSDEEVESQIQARIDQTLQMMNNDVSQFEDYYGMTMNELKTSLIDGQKKQLLAERMRGSIMQDIKVTPSEVIDYFNMIPKDSLPYFNSEVELGEIVMTPKPNSVSLMKARTKLEEIRNKIINGEDFAELAKKESDDFGSGRIGGDLGWQKRGTFVPEFEAAAYNLDENEISGIIESEFGFHLIQLLGRRGSTIHARHILIKPAILEEDKLLTKNLLDSISDLIKKDSITFGYAVKKWSNEKAQSFNNGGRMMNPKTGTYYFEMSELEPEIYFAIDTLESNEISKAIEFATRTGDVEYKLIYLMSESNPHKASLEADYDKIKRAALESKKTEHLINWVKTKISKTFVELKDDYMYCPNMKAWLE